MIENELRFEEEKNPEQVVSNAVKAVENKDAADSVISSSWVGSVKNFWKDEEGGISIESAKKIGKKIGKTAGITAGVSVGIGFFLSYKVLRGVYEFTKKAIQKKGDVGFSEGYKIGEEMLSFGDKKEKK
ncbi:MAG: hypothetical protein A3G45_00200 [Candidatus Staskawiczbacteria bacterium RIFCSPLOWO2_12_FULL_37_15]|uniref:Uncharacterized protein n=1 Tax=Candidatus Staskawiczbacteria bacterium RIFCSPLOWO2_12_FULL_37_15 TaxID=1802218 RepID=A0A1G2IQN6_9BACT|nr:MAG: hypothetical protein US35_C0017G0005 [Parcubacteria group bacterium GW2011_GWA2_37_10]OGZ76690.1 MAG: hypothetical protein A3G45_00200 [Candidatus Staskawiczbacteria bacterium RIFCSPLOWO2_12_FULL_37_15]